MSSVSNELWYPFYHCFLMWNLQPWSLDSFSDVSKFFKSKSCEDYSLIRGRFQLVSVGTVKPFFTSISDNPHFLISYWLPQVGMDQERFTCIGKSLWSYIVS